MKITQQQIHEAIRQVLTDFINETTDERWETKKGVPETEREVPPKVTIKAYKQVMLDTKNPESGLVFPLYIKGDGVTKGWRVGQWYNAGTGDCLVQIDDETGKPTGEVRVAASLSGTKDRPGLSYRPGYLFGSLAYAPHIYTAKPNAKEIENSHRPIGKDGKRKPLPANYDYSQSRMQSKDIVWAECDLSFDVDYNEQARQNGFRKNKNGQEKWSAGRAYIKDIPTDGAYEYRTNTNAPKYATWYIAGAFKINRILSDEEVASICQQNNIKPLDREGGLLDLSRYKF